MTRPRSVIAASSLLLCTLLWLGGCDNPACVFGGSCADGLINGALGTEPASVPVEGEQILGGVPTVVSVFPTGTMADIETPIVVVFSESMSPSNLAFAFEIVSNTIGGAVGLQASALVGDGHMAVLFPLAPLQEGEEYSVRFRENVKLFDRTGQAVVPPANRVIGTFGTAVTVPETPTVLATWPLNAAQNQSPTTEIDVVFSRGVEPTTVTDGSWVVTVDGVAPPQDPVAQPVTLAGLAPDFRVFRWRSVGAMGEPVVLGTAADVRLEISPAGNPVEDVFFAPVPNTVITFETLPFEAPMSAAITSMPDDAIGIAQLSGPADFAVEVALSGAMAGDRLGVYLFGKEPQPNPPVPFENLRTIAVQREVDLVAPFTTFTWTAAELDLIRTTSPLAGRFTDGTVTFAFYIKRSAAVSPVKLLDVDSSQNGTQSPVQDLVRPVLLGLSTSGTSVTAYKSDTRDVVIVGRASEPLRAALVETSLGDNVTVMGELPAVTGSHSSGLFVAAPVRVGVMPAAAPSVIYMLTVHDRALNAAPTVTGRFTQVGQAANGPRVGLFTNVTVDVFNATTRAPVAGAIVHVHENLSGFTAPVDTGTTDPNGRVVLAPALLGETIVTVDATALGFELFTFDGIPTDSLSIPLRPQAPLGALASGSISTTDTTFPAYLKGVSDTRFPTPGETLVGTAACALNSQMQLILCNFGPTAIRAREMGAQSAVVVLEPPNLFVYSPLTFLRAFSLALPLPPAEPGTTQANTLVMGPSLGTGTFDPEELPVDVQPFVLSTANWPAIPGRPAVRVEATSPGLPHDVTVGRGIAFNDGLPANTWAVRAAYPGSVDGIADVAGDELGRFVTSQTVDADLLLRAEVVDAAGNRGGVRPRLSMISATHTPPPAPVIGPAPFALNTDTLDFAFSDVIPDAVSQPGIYRVVLTDALGARWTVWRLDASDLDGPDAVVHLPLIGPGGTLPLFSGDLGARVSAFAWPTFDPASFLWTDVDREFNLFAHTTTVTVTPP